MFLNSYIILNVTDSATVRYSVVQPFDRFNPNVEIITGDIDRLFSDDVANTISINKGQVHATCQFTNSGQTVLHMSHTVVRNVSDKHSSGMITSVTSGNTQAGVFLNEEDMCKYFFYSIEKVLAHNTDLKLPNQVDSIFDFITCVKNMKDIMESIAHLKTRINIKQPIEFAFK